MCLFYSAAKAAFYDDDIHDQLPPDVRPVSREAHAALMAMQGEGMAIVADPNGDPVAVPPPPPAAEERIASIRATRDKLLRLSDFTQLPDYPSTDQARAAWGAYRQALRDLPSSIDNLDAVEWPVSPDQ